MRQGLLFPDEVERRRVLLVRGSRSKLGWVPVSSALVGRRVDLMERGGRRWDRGWRVAMVFYGREG
jgi:hypothetical protein